MSNDLNVKIDATTTGYEAAIARAERQTKTFEYSLRQAARAEQQAAQHTRDLEVALNRQHDAMDKGGKTAFVFGAAVAAGLAMAVNEAVKWESAWTGVTKTVDGSGAQMQELEDGLRKLATTLPATHEEIAAVAEAAGQLGIKREAIIDFTKTMIDLSETTNLTAEQAATDMARFANIMGTPQDEIDRLGASLVALGNDGASTEADILSMAMRIAGAGAQLNLTEGEVLGLANALSSVGIEAEAGGSAISTVMKKIQLDVSTGSARLAQFAEVAGMSAEAFSALWKRDAAAGLAAFTTGLGDISAEGGDTIKTLHDLEITEIRQSDALLRLAGSVRPLTTDLKLGNEAWAENTALLEEAEKRYATTEAKVQIARNSLRDAGITVGDVLLPALAAMATATADIISAWSDLPGPIKTGVTLLALLAAGVALTGGAMMIAIPKIAAYRTALAGLEAGALKTLGTRLSGVAGVLAGPWGLALGAGITALGIFAAKHGEASRKVDESKARIDSLTDALVSNKDKWEETIKSYAIDELGKDGGVLQQAEKLGLDLGLVTDAAIGAGDAFEQLKSQLAGIEVPTVTDQDLFGSSDPGALRDEVNATNERKTALEGLIATISGVRGETDSAVAAANRKIAADEGSADSADKAAAAQKGTNQAWGDGADAAGELTEEVKTLLEQMEELSGTYLNNREAGRAVRGSLRDIRKALAEYREEHGGLSGAFKDGSKSGDEFAAMLDDLAQDYQRQINATAELTGSEKKTMQQYRESRTALIAMADQLGMTKEEAEEYAKKLLGTPAMIRTQFEQPGMAAALAKIQTYSTWLANVPPVIRTEIITNQRTKQNENPALEANGGIRQAFADGGFDSSGRYVERVPQIARGGADIRWGEIETGWEAYISGKPGMKERNRGVWLEAGRRLGILPEALKHASVAGRTFDRGGFSGADMGRLIAAGNSRSLAGLRVEGHIDLGDGLGGYLRGVIQEEIAENDRFDRVRSGG